MDTNNPDSQESNPDQEGSAEVNDTPEESATGEQLRKEVLRIAREWVQHSKGCSPVIATTGKSGVGKSTLINNFLELEDSKKCPVGDGPDPMTLDVKIVEDEKFQHDDESKITITLIDTPGLGDIDRKMKSILKDLSDKLKTQRKEVDILLYCASLHPASRFNETDVEIIKTFTKAYGSEIWKHTILALTFANADNRIHKSEDDYKRLIEAYARRFQQTLRQAKVTDVEVKSIISEKVDIGAIPAIPIGNDSSGKDLEYVSNWSDLLLQEILNRSDPSVAIQLLKWKGLLPKSTEAAVELTGGIIAGAATGGAVGAAIGAPFALVGIVPGVAVGVPTGAAVGGGIWLGTFIVSWLRRKQTEKQQPRKPREELGTITPSK